MTYLNDLENGHCDPDDIYDYLEAYNNGHFEGEYNSLSECLGFTEQETRDFISYKTELSDVLQSYGHVMFEVKVDES